MTSDPLPGTDPTALTEPASEATWAGPPERLDRVLSALGLARSRSRAAELIATGQVRVDGLRPEKPGARVRTGSSVSLLEADRYVGRAANKLLAGLAAFRVDPTGRVALDLGASTGGFTQVLLERGARIVLAVDVGHDQLAPSVRADPRVRVVEGRNARDLDAKLLAADAGLDEAPTLVVADLSFISLRLILPAIERTAARDAELILLIKPQFEVGRVRDGVVTNPNQWAEAIRAVVSAAAGCGFETRGLETSPVLGGSGNREFLGYFVRGDDAIQREWEGRISQLTGA